MSFRVKDPNSTTCIVLTPGTTFGCNEYVSPYETRGTSKFHPFFHVRYHASTFRISSGSRINCCFIVKRSKEIILIQFSMLRHARIKLRCCPHNCQDKKCDQSNHHDPKHCWWSPTFIFIFIFIHSMAHQGSDFGWHGDELLAILPLLLEPSCTMSCVQKTCQQTIAASCKDAFTCFWLGIFQTTQLTLSGQHCVQRDVLKPGRFDCRFGFGRMRRFGCHWKKSLSRCRPSTVWAIPQLLQIAHSDPAEWSDKMDFWHIEKMRENLETPQVEQHFPVTPCDPMAFRRFAVSSASTFWFHHPVDLRSAFRWIFRGFVTTKEFSCRRGHLCHFSCLAPGKTAPKKKERCKTIVTKVCQRMAWDSSKRLLGKKKVLSRVEAWHRTWLLKTKQVR